MAATIVIEEERGTCVTSRHPHNGYYAGSFAGSRLADSSLSLSALRTVITSSVR